ncbi:MAG TPA: tetratricopeptide repeat protein [Burkholderiales bacterium]|jgi:tetratricopeptide (TPR) repeat protein|nr:tetratricopeptide repeat protein [Burkholderiales bacterium]
MEMTGTTPAALEAYERSLQALWTMSGDARAQAEASVRVAPGFVAGHELIASLLLYSRDKRAAKRGERVLAELRQLPMNERERAHVAALRLAADGDLGGARAVYDALLTDSPRDMLALWAAQVIDYYFGDPHTLRARIERVLPAWPESTPGRHAVLAMHAFGLEESGDYEAAEAAARAALTLEPRDLRALHALFHVFEMQSRPQAGIRYASARKAALPNHLWWHTALFHMQLGRMDRALDVYDQRLKFEDIDDLIDASSLLWRLQLGGVDVGTRFAALAERWAPFAEDAFCAFNDVHAMMAFASARRWTLAESLLAAQSRRIARGWGINNDMTKLVGLPASRALQAFMRGQPARAEALLRGLPPVAHRLGGSHAQRDVLQLTRAAAAVAARQSRFLSNRVAA